MITDFNRFLKLPRRTLSAFARFARIPMHTMDNWRAGRRLPPEWAQKALLFVFDAWEREVVL